MSRLNGYLLPLGPSDAGNAAEGGIPDFRKVASSTVASATSSSTSLTNLMYTLFVPANTFTTNEVLDIRAVGRINRGVASHTGTLRFYWGTTASISGATLLGTCTFANSSGTVGEKQISIHRRLGVRNTTTQTIVLDTVKNTSTDLREFTSDNNSFMTGGIDLVAVNWTVDGYFMVQGDVSNTATWIQILWMKINN
jgi:hypothetical protein